MTNPAAFGGTTTYSYDAAGRPTAQADPNGETVTRTFSDDDTLASQVLRNGGGTTLASWSYLYDNLYRQTQQSFSGVGAAGATIPAQASATFQFSYDAASRLSSFNPTGSPNQQLSYDHDSNRRQADAVRSQTRRRDQPR